MKKVLVLFGGNSYEHEISCKSVMFLIKHIDKQLFDFKVVGIDFNNNWYQIDNPNLIDENWEELDKEYIENIFTYLKKFDIVFPLIHGYSLEDGKLQSLFELYNIKYVGSDSLSSAICYDKSLTKIILEKHNIPQVNYTIYNKDTNLKDIKLPVIIKPAKCGSSIGINVANSLNELKKSIKQALKYDNTVIIERYVKKRRELECAVLQEQKKLIISDIGEIISNDWYSFDLKYNSNIDTTISNIDEKIRKEIKKMTKKIFNLLNCKDLARVDFLYDLENKKLYFNEINTMPGFTNISMYPKLLKNCGIDYKNLITKLLLS